MEADKINEEEGINVKDIPPPANDQKKGGIQFIVYDADTKKPVKANIYVDNKPYSTDDDGKLYLELDLESQNSEYEFSVYEYTVKADGYKDETGYVITERSKEYVQNIPLKKAVSIKPKQFLPRYQHSFTIFVVNKLTGKPYEGALVNVIESSSSGIGFKWAKITDSSGRAFFKITTDMPSGTLQVFAKNYKFEDDSSWYENKYFNFTDTKVFIKDSGALQFAKPDIEEKASEKRPETIEYKSAHGEELNELSARIRKIEEELEKPKKNKEARAQRRISLLFQLLDTLFSEGKITEEEYNQLKQEVDTIATDYKVGKVTLDNVLIAINDLKKKIRKVRKEHELVLMKEQVESMVKAAIENISSEKIGKLSVLPIAYSESDLAHLFPKKIKVVIQTYKTKENNLDMDELFEHERKTAPSGYSYYIYNVIRLNSLIETKLKAFIPFPDFYYKSGCYIFGPYYDSDYGIPSIDIIIQALKDYMIPKPFQPWFIWIAENVIPDVRKQKKESVGKIYYYKEA